MNTRHDFTPDYYDAVLASTLKAGMQEMRPPDAARQALLEAAANPRRGQLTAIAGMVGEWLDQFALGLDGLAESLMLSSGAAQRRVGVRGGAGLSVYEGVSGRKVLQSSIVLELLIPLR